MTEEKPARAGASAGVVVALVLIAALGGGAFVYTLGGNSLAASTTTVTTTAQQLNTVTQTVVGSSNTSQTIDPVTIYAEANTSVVTVTGYVATSFQSFFGPVTQISELLGSGFVVNQNGDFYIVTNFHVVDSAQNITVTFGDGNAYPAKVLGADPYADMAVVSVPSAPSSEFHPLTLGHSSQLVVGQPVVAIGNPFGLSGSMTVGIVSQLGRTITETTSGTFDIPDVIQFSAAINPGNSGGPLLDSQGTVVGVTTAVASNSQGVGFAIPSDTISRELPSLISSGTYTMHPDLGINGTDNFYQLAQAEGTNVTYGVVIEAVTPGGAAANAGLKGGSNTVSLAGTQYAVGGDIIISVNGTKIVNTDSLLSYLEERTLPGANVVLGIIRGGAPMTVQVTLGVRSAP